MIPGSRPRVVPGGHGVASGTPRTAFPLDEGTGPRVLSGLAIPPGA